MNAERPPLTIRLSVASRAWAWEVLLVVLAIIVTLVGMAMSEHFTSTGNLNAILSNQAERALMLVPIVLLLIAGEIDLSIASVAGLASVIMGAAFEAGAPIAVGIGLALLAGAAAGLLNGWLVARVGLPSLVVTLATLALFRGLASVVLEGQSVSGFPTWFTDLGYGRLAGSLLPTALIPFLITAIAGGFVLHRTTIGRTIYAIGSNAVASRFAGLPVDGLRIGLFVLSGTVAAFAGVVYAARFASTRADAAIGFELDVIAAALLGGVSVFGGRGTMAGAVLGLLVLALVRGALTLANVPAEVQLVVVGSLLIGAVVVANASAQSDSGSRR